MQVPMERVDAALLAGVGDARDGRWTARAGR